MGCRVADPIEVKFNLPAFSVIYGLKGITHAKRFLNPDAGFGMQVPMMMCHVQCYVLQAVFGLQFVVASYDTTGTYPCVWNSSHINSPLSF